MKALIAIGLLWAGVAAADDAGPAEATVERFTAALVAGDFKRVAAELAPEALILESGVAELSAAEYLAGHARHDHVFLKSAAIERRHRRAHASGDLAWVATLSTIRLEKDGRPLALSSTESMVLRRGAAGWRIVHIHWSSHAVKDGPG